MTNKSDSSRNASRIILVIVGLLVLSGLGWWVPDYFKKKQQNEEYLANIDKLNTEIMELEEKILNFEVALEDKNMQLAEKEKELEEKYMELETVVARLAQAKKTNKADQARIQQLENRLKELQDRLEQSRVEIDYLKAQNAQLTGQVDSLSTTTIRLRQENTDLKMSEEETRRELEETREIASMLRTADLRIINVRKSGREKEDEEFRRGSLYDLKVCFTVQENLIAEPGPREIYMVYENPDGTINTNYTAGYSGRFTYGEAEKTYTAKAQIQYDGSAQEVCVLFSPEEDFKYQKGIQYVSLYAEGKLIGQGNFRLK